ncbi:MAG TPA: exosortase/archaeosortase family protein [Myxococcota bacterium]|nr:exosortase/archaeosortase family protein [Myxococcota bacterium]
MAVIETQAKRTQRAWQGLQDALLVALVGIAFAPGLAAMARVWGSVDYLSHGYLIPFVAAWAAWRDRATLAALPARRDRRGLLLLLTALLLYGLGLAAGLVELEGVAFVSAVAASVLLLRGPQWLRALRFPIGFLLFMVPPPEALLLPLIVWLRVLVTTVAVGILHLMKIPVVQEGNVLLLPGGESVFVADACSGVTSLITLLPLAVLLAYYVERSLARRLLLVSSVVPIALGGNLLRVVVTVIAALGIGVARATDSVLHQAAGLLTYLLGCLALLAVSAIMRRLVPPK